MARTLVRVTSKYIKNGGKTFENCPVAQAVNEAVGQKCAWISSGGYECRMGGILSQDRRKLPRSVSRFVIRYDNKKSVRPFNFFLPN